MIRARRFVLLGVALCLVAAQWVMPAFADGEPASCKASCGGDKKPVECDCTAPASCIAQDAGQHQSGWCRCMKNDGTEQDRQDCTTTIND